MEKKQTENHDLWETADIGRRVQLLCKVLPNKLMDETRLKKLLEIADEQDQVKLKVLYNAVIKGVNEYNKNASQIKLKNWKSAEKELDAYIDKLWARYIDNETIFPNLLAVIKHLKDNNWKISKSRAYQHHDEGKIKPQTNGTYRQGDVEKYTATYLKKADGKTVSGKLKEYQDRRSMAETRKMEAQAEHAEMKIKAAKGLYVPREAFEQELAKRATVFKSDVENFIRAGAEKIIALVGGDPAKAPALIEYQMDAAADWLNRYDSDKEFKVPVPAVMAAAMKDEDFDDEEKS
jgi:hypothetical protein